jgi:DNA-binding transcriptional regulator YdaS (Cro superfamily)
MKTEREPILAAALDKAGGVGAVAEALGVTLGAVSQWKRCPPQHVVALAQLSGISSDLLRPDIFVPTKCKKAAR